MFKIAPINERDIQKKYAEICGAEFLDGFFAYAMTDNETGELMGFSQFEINSDGYIVDLCPATGLDDFEAMFILGRSTMNFIDMCGAHFCRAKKDAADEKLLRAIGFKPDGDELSVDMTGMFDGSHCSGHAVKL